MVGRLSRSLMMPYPARSNRQLEAEFLSGTSWYCAVALRSPRVADARGDEQRPARAAYESRGDGTDLGARHRPVAMRPDRNEVGTSTRCKRGYLGRRVPM